ncbi:MAG: phosphatidylserine decarboxylase 1 [Chaenotheca gracillima]|nr:MAG: phosphatidylserine decarboxylase 1 [Chaenotheca gracillima]
METNRPPEEPLHDASNEQTSSSISLPASTGPAIAINVLASSDQKLLLSAVPATTTVAELKRKIQNALPNGPSPERQRLIVRGRLLGRDADTVHEVFGQPAVSSHLASSSSFAHLAQFEDTAAQTVHLVIRPEHFPLASNIQQNQPPSANANSINVQVPPAPGSLNAQPQPEGATRVTPPQVHQYTLNTGQGLPLSALPPQLHQIINAQIQGQIHAHLNNHFAQSVRGVQQTQGVPLNPIAPMSGHSAPRPPEDAPLERSQAEQALSGSDGQASQESRQIGSSDASQLFNSDGSSGSSSSNRPHENINVGGTNGRDNIRVQVTVNDRSFTGPSVSNIAGSGGGLGASTIPVHAQTPTNPVNTQNLSGFAARDPHQPPAPQRSGQPSSAAMLASLEERRNHLAQLRHIEQELQRLDAGIRSRPPVRQESDGNEPSNPGNVPRPEDIANNLNESVARLASTLNSANVPRRDSGRIEQNTGSLPPAFGSSSHPAMMMGNGLTGRVLAPLAPNTVYLLSSPTGPYGILLSPSGTYASNQTSSFNGNILVGQQDALGRVPAQGHVAPGAQMRADLPQNLNALFANVPGVRAPAPPQAAAQAHAQAQAQAQAGAQPGIHIAQGNLVRDNLRLLFPLGFGGTFWLAVRVLGFMLFFGSGAGSWRTVLTLLLVGMVYGLQAGVLAGFQDALLGPIRRHLDGILHEDQRPNGERQPRPGQDGGTSQSPQGGDPDPGFLADRLAREHEERHRAGTAGMLRARVRSVERALVLFLASLVPGVGEQHIAARDAAAAERRQREEERTRLDQEQAAGNTAENDVPEPSPVERQADDAGGAEAHSAGHLEERPANVLDNPTGEPVGSP